MFYDFIQKTFELEKAGRKIIKLNLGQTNLPAPECAVNAAIDSIRNEKADYCSARGIPVFLDAVAKREGCRTENIVCGNGSKTLIVALINVLTEIGDKVLIPTPCWPAYNLICRQFNRMPVPITSRIEELWHFDCKKIENAKLLLLCNPLNPASIVYENNYMLQIFKKAEKTGIKVIIDEAYRGIALEEIPDYDAIRIRSFSKEFNMEGWRLGYVVAHEEISKKILNYIQLSTTCVPGFIQKAGLACLLNEGDILKRNREIWNERIDNACGMLLNAGFSFSAPQAGMYVFAGHKMITDSYSFAMRLLEEGVAVSPGIFFGGYDNFIRISLNCDEKTMEEAVSIIKKCL